MAKMGVGVKPLAPEMVTSIGPKVTNGAKFVVEASFPYMARIRVKGIADYLFHAWSVEGVEAKGKAAKGSIAKKTDDLESYVYRNAAGELGIPGFQFRAALIAAAKFRQDPRSPRKSAMDLFKAGVAVLTEYASLGLLTWDYEHKCRVVIHGNAITRVRPAIKIGWEVDFDVLVNLPEYISPDTLLEVAVNAGRLCGVGNYRPTYGRFQVTSFEPIEN
jgi:hypothetical protein